MIDSDLYWPYATRGCMDGEAARGRYEHVTSHPLEVEPSLVSKGICLGGNFAYA